MFAGHLAIGLALKARFPKVPALPIMVGVCFLDILDGLFIALGWNQVTPDPQAGPYLFFDLTFIDWDHSLLAALVWSAVWGAFFLKDKRVALIAFVACISHFFADWPLHNGDLALFPHSQAHLGFGLWGKLGTTSWVLEAVFSAVLVAYAWWASTKRGVSLLWPSAVIALMLVRASPWLSPMKALAIAPGADASMRLGIMVTGGFLVAGLLTTWLVNRAERRSGLTR